MDTEEDIYLRMDDEIEGKYSGARNITYDMKLNKVLMDHDIKTFLVNAGARSFADVQDDLDKIYNNYPRTAKFLTGTRWRSLPTRRSILENLPICMLTRHQTNYHTCLLDFCHDTLY